MFYSKSGEGVARLRISEVDGTPLYLKLKQIWVCTINFFLWKGLLSCLHKKRLTKLAVLLYNKIGVCHTIVLSLKWKVQNIYLRKHFSSKFLLSMSSELIQEYVILARTKAYPAQSCMRWKSKKIDLYPSFSVNSTRLLMILWPQ